MRKVNAHFPGCFVPIIFLMLLPEDVAVLKPIGVSDLITSALCMQDTRFSHREMVWYEVLQIGSPSCLLFRRYSNLNSMLYI